MPCDVARLHLKLSDDEAREEDSKCKTFREDHEKLMAKRRSESPEEDAFERCLVASHRKGKERAMEEFATCTRLLKAPSLGQPATVQLPIPTTPKP